MRGQRLPVECPVCNEALEEVDEGGDLRSHLMKEHSKRELAKAVHAYFEEKEERSGTISE
ncbi:hypothetical protein [Halegenticoccus soli]|uniref:hypothetical protein n=1 Tax=Halegenticoccus soli TaxID=1985678 RepID=UPI000C6E0C6A|nr:hypothetical protein [Halegenticoccus soli]